MMVSDYQRRTRKILRECGAFVDGGHFVYNSGNHGDFYINKDALYMYPRKLDDICVMLTEVAQRTFDYQFDVVLAPAVAGVVLGQGIAYNVSLESGKDILFAYAEKNPFNSAHRTVRRGYEHIIKGRKVLLVDDITSTGKTLAAMAQAVAALGGIAIGSVVICDRGQVRTLKVLNPDGSVAELRIEPLVELDLQTFGANNCPLCKAGRPIDTQVGQGNMLAANLAAGLVSEDKHAID